MRDVERSRERRRAVARDPGEDVDHARPQPGKTAATHALTAEPTASQREVLLERAFDHARTRMAALEAALQATDVGRALRAVVEVNAAVAALRAQFVPACEAAFATLVGEAEALVRRAPQPSATAMRSGAAGSWDAWDREIAAWRAGDANEAIARRGVAGPAHALPFSDRIQASFGRHDVSAVRAHSDEGAAAAARQLGARAYAFGDAVAFAVAPDLFTAAHEAAHVVQQRAGVGCAGDEHEAHADRVAAAVVAGVSAVALLDQMSPQAGAGAVVQRKTEGEAIRDFTQVPQAIEARLDVAWAYLRANEARFLAAIETRLATVRVPAGLAWVPGGIAKQFGEALRLELKSRPLFDALPELLHPADPWYVIDQNRSIVEGFAGQTIAGHEPQGPMTWAPLAGEALAGEVGARVEESLARMAPRYLAKLPGHVAVADLVTSHPIDRVTARLLCDERVARPGPQQRASARGPFRDGVRYVTDYRWLGDTDAKLWNWIEVRAPRDATAEEVAATLWLDPAASARAYGITGAPPFFRIDPAWARKLVRGAPDVRDAAHGDNALELAASSFATAAAISQARGEEAPALDKLDELLERSERQLARAKDQLASWRLSELVQPALRWVATQREHLSQPAPPLVELAPVIAGQQALLYEAAAVLAELTAFAPSAAADGPNGIVTTAIRLYATAMGESHLLVPAREALSRARAARAGLPFALLAQSGADTANAVAALRAHEGQMSFGGEDAAKAVAAERQRIFELSAKHRAGQAVDPDEVDLLSAQLKEQAVEATAKTWYLTLAEVGNEARDARFGGFETMASLCSVEIRQLPGHLFRLVAELDEHVIQQHAKNKANALREASDPSMKARAWALREAAGRTEQNLQAFLEKHKVRQYFRAWLKVIERQQVRTAVFRIATQIALLIGTSVVGGMVGTFVAGSVRGALLADAAASSLGLARAAQVAGVVGDAAGLVADAALNAGVQVATSDAGAGESFITNVISSGAVRVALAPLHRVMAAYGVAEREVANLDLWERTVHRGKLALRAGVTLSAEVVAGAAVNYVVQRASFSGQPDEKTAMEWALEGASLTIGGLIGRWLHGFHARVAVLAEHGAHLSARARRMQRLVDSVAETGDKNVALELLPERYDALVEEARTIHELTTSGKLSARSAATLEAGNRTDVAALQHAAFATMPLRLAGLAPDDASGKVWIGATEDIAIALHQAHRAGLAVDVLGHDAAARQWRIRYNGEELTILERPLEGRPRPSKPAPTEADRLHAQRYAQASEFLQERWEATTKAEIDGRAVIQFDHLQVGYAYGGVVNQATLPATGEALDHKVVIYSHKGTLSGRGAQELGQVADSFDAPGVRATEQAPGTPDLLRSAELGRALAVGRIETQTPAYHGVAVEIQARPKGPLPADWAAEAGRRAFRVRIRDAAGTDRWFYCDLCDGVGGVGPGRLDYVAKVVDPAHLDPMLAKNQIVRGEDPDYAAKIRPGRILVWGSTPTGAWAAEPAVHPHGAQVTLLGDTRPPSDWPTLLREYADITAEITAHNGELPATLIARKAAIEALIAKAHPGRALRRNTKPGAAYDAAAGVSVEFGTPSKIVPTPDGKVAVTIGTGEHAETTIYDQVVIAHGQDPGAPGAPGGLLGRGAQDAQAEVPAGTIALRPIYGPARPGREPEVLGLESIDPPGIRLLGAAHASKRMAPWVERSERARFERAVDEMADEHAATRDHGPISDDSRGVSAGVEAQRDRIPRANEILAAKAYRLPGPDHTLELDPAHRERWDDQVRTFFAINLRANERWVRVKRLGGGRSGAVVYRVWIDESDIGVFKLFDRHGATTERDMLQLLERAKLTKMKPVHERGVIGVDPKTGFDGALLMDTAKGTSVQEMIDALPTDRAMRAAALEKLTAAVQQVAAGLAEMHVKLASGRMMSREAKASDANYFLDKAFRSGAEVERVKAQLGEADFARVKEKLEGPVLEAFLAAKIPETAYHGDANAGNFILDKYDGDLGHFEQLSVIDVGKMTWSVDRPRGVGTKTGAADVARFLGSLESLRPGALSAGDVHDLRASFIEAYFAESAALGARINRNDYAAAERWYRIEMEVAALATDPSAKQRILQLLSVGDAP